MYFFNVCSSFLCSVVEPPLFGAATNVRGPGADSGQISSAPTTVPDTKVCNFELWKSSLLITKILWIIFSLIDFMLIKRTRFFFYLKDPAGAGSWLRPTKNKGSGYATLNERLALRPLSPALPLTNPGFFSATLPTFCLLHYDPPPPTHTHTRNTNPDYFMFIKHLRFTELKKRFYAN